MFFSPTKTMFFQHAIDVFLEAEATIKPGLVVRLGR
jgi:hypothetical protein